MFLLVKERTSSRTCVFLREGGWSYVYTCEVTPEKGIFPENCRNGSAIGGAAQNTEASMYYITGVIRTTPARKGLELLIERIIVLRHPPEWSANRLGLGFCKFQGNFNFSIFPSFELTSFVRVRIFWRVLFKGARRATMMSMVGKRDPYKNNL